MDGFDPENKKVFDAFFKRHSSGNKKRKIALFDADGTLWRGDLGEEFFKEQLRVGSAPKAPAGAWETYFQEVNHGDAIKAYLWIAQWNAGVRESDLRSWAREFFKKKFANHVFDPMRKLAARLVKDGFEIWVITASPRWTVQSGVEALGIDPERVIGTSVEIRGGILTDKPVLPIPYRDGKALLAQKTVGQAPVFVAGNTLWDKEMLQLSTDVALAVYSENKGEPNYDSEQSLQALVRKRRSEGVAAKTKVQWLSQNF